MLFYIYIIISVIIALLIIKEMFVEKDWKNQISLALLLIPFLLRIFLIK